MYRVLLADDEALEREGLRILLSKNFDGQFDIYEASNGREAIEKAYEIKPDIIIMDIKMPGINGIEATAEIRKRLGNVKIIVLSAYDSFSYAKEAVNLNVFEYLLKPIKRSVMIECIERAIKLQDKEREKIQRELKLKEKLSSVIPYIENEMVASIILGDIDKTDILQNMNLINFKYDKGFCIVFAYDGPSLKRIHNQIEKNYIKKRIENKIRECLKKNFDCIVSKGVLNNIVGVIRIENEQDTYKLRSVSIDFAREVTCKIENETNVIMKVGIGNEYKGLEKSSKSYKEALIALKVDSPSKKVNHFADINVGNIFNEEYPFEKEAVLTEKIKMGLLQESQQLFEEIIDWIFNTHSDGSNKKIKLIELSIVINRVVRSKLQNIDIENKVNRYMEYEDSYRSLNLLKNEIRKDLILAINSINNTREKEMDSIIIAAKEYIMKNYSKELSLEEVAHDIAVSPYYFSKLFKKKTGENFIDYLTKIRIKSAQELLRETSKSVKIIAHSVGYNDPNYFSRVFKKITGMSPREFKLN
ncbi:response regulator [Wukongibacter sp. M2B1]|uniref:response regulator n=1 Tax=Wukongibacter sp. M2B1 TaxID=3088895 RepID=UPI003D79FE19